MKSFVCFLALTALTLLAASSAARAEGKVIVHEWGTFTCLQDEHGNAIGAINVDDEPVPGFVFQYANLGVVNKYSVEQQNFGLPPYGANVKGWTPADPTVTMRLETPVIYIYPPKGQTPQSVPPLDVHVDFHGGVLSQYYPYAKTGGALLNGDQPYLKDKGIAATMTTSLTWKGVQLGASGKLLETQDKDLQGAPWMRGQPVETEDKVWNTPREVSAPLLQVKFSLSGPGGGHDCVQAEHFLFYRGLGHLDSPLHISSTAGTRAADFGPFSIEPFYPAMFKSTGWWVEIRTDGSCAFVDLPSFGIGEKSAMTLKGAEFKPGDFTTGNLAKLKASMHDALVKEGLYDDEATAMLKTWELSYFKSPGLRFFYIVPRTWVDKVLPLQVSGAPTDITRVMVGRIELVTDAQKAALARLAAGPCPDLAAFKSAATDALGKGKIPDADKKAYFTGDKPLSDLGLPIPPLIQDYLSLGRFRDALILHEEQNEHASPALAQFIKDNQLSLREN